VLSCFASSANARDRRRRAPPLTKKKKREKSPNPPTKNKTTDRDALKVTQRPYEGIPLSLQLELLLGALLALAGGCALAGALKPIASEKGAPSLDQGSYRPDCVYFGHRGRALPRPDIPSVY
jgi:hypothetical protein